MIKHTILKNNYFYKFKFDIYNNNLYPFLFKLQNITEYMLRLKTQLMHVEKEVTKSDIYSNSL